MNLIKQLNSRSIVLGLLCSTFALNSFAQSGASSSLMSFDGIKKLWEQASPAGEGLDISGWTFLEGSDFSVIVAPAEDEDEDISFISKPPKPKIVPGAPSGQPALGAEDPSSSQDDAKPKPQQSRVLNTSRLGSSKRAALIERLALMKIFLNRAESMTSFSSGSEVQNLNRWKTSAQIELSLMHMALAFDATQWTDKCRFLREANQYSVIASNTTISLDERWSQLRGKLSFATTRYGFATKTSPVKDSIAAAMGLCSSAPPLSKAEQEARARAYVNQFLRTQVKTMIANTQTAIQGPKEAYKKLQDLALADVRTDDILTFRRDFDNAISNLKLVEQDMMYLYKVPKASGSDQLSLIDQLKEADLKKLFNPKETDQATLGKLTAPINQVRASISSMLAEIEMIPQLDNAKLKMHCSGLKDAFEAWNLIEKMPPKLTDGLEMCLETASKAFEAAKRIALDPNESKDRATLREIEKLSEFVTK